MTPPPPSRREDANPEWFMESASSLWPARESDDADGEQRTARDAAERFALETGLPVTPHLVGMLEDGIRAVLFAMFEQIPATGPLPGQNSSRPRLAQLRARDLATPSGRRTGGVVELLLSWDVMEERERAQWLSSLVVGRDSWDGEHFGSSAVWATSGVGHGAPPASDEAAKGWAWAVDRLLNGDERKSRREKISALVLQFRTNRLALRERPA